MGKNNHPENKYRKWFSTAITYLIAGGLCWYMLWASAISHYTVLQNTVPEWTTYFCTGITTGSLSFIYAFYIRTFNRTLKYLLNAFTGGFCLGFILSLNCYDVCVYLFPDKVISYKSEYDVVFPGPSKGKYGHCETGLWLKDQNTSRWIQLCTNKEFLRSHHKQGMAGVWVTARVNKIGSYIVKYEFIYM